MIRRCNDDYSDQGQADMNTKHSDPSMSGYTRPIFGVGGPRVLGPVMKWALSKNAMMACAVLGIIAYFSGIVGFPHAAMPPEISILSSRPDLVSGGDALVEIRTPAGVHLNQIRLTLNGNDVTNQLRFDAASGGFRGLIGGMVVGENTLIAKIISPKPVQASLKVTNYPITG